MPWFLTSEDSCYRWGFRLTPYSYRINRYTQAPKDIAKVYRSRQLPRLGGSGEEYMNQMLAVCGKATFRTNVNLPNSGQMGKVPSGAVVETNAIFSGGGVEPVASGSLPDPVNNLVLTHITNQETLIKAVFARDRDLAFQAFLNEPLCHRLGVDEAWELFNTMVRKTNFKF